MSNFPPMVRGLAGFAGMVVLLLVTKAMIPLVPIKYGWEHAAFEWLWLGMVLIAGVVLFTVGFELVLSARAEKTDRS